jgi:hypothetical protein
VLDKNFFTKLNDIDLEKKLMASPQHKRDMAVQNMEVACNDYKDFMGEPAYRREIRSRLGI